MRKEAVLKPENEVNGFLNAGDEALKKRRENFYYELNSENKNYFFLVRQVHGNNVFVLNDERMTPENLSLISADAIATRLIDRPIAVVTADCIPLVICDALNKAIAVVHAGREGTRRRIFSKTVKTMGREFGSRPETLTVALGPSIQSCCYEVGESCRPAFEGNGYDWGSIAKPASKGKFMLDLYAANLQDGLKAGLRRERISFSEYCTSCRLDLFYSYRREGKTGRMITSAMMLE